jgi:AmmeMemoRadiSam system protein A
MPVSSCIKLPGFEQIALSNLVWQVLESSVASSDESSIQGSTQGKQCILPSPPTSDILTKHAASFVTLYIGGKLRGCIGSYQASQPLWQNVCQNAFYSAHEDHRFSPLKAAELTKLAVDVSILSDLVPMDNNGEPALLAQLQPKNDGLLIKEGELNALFLPVVWQALPGPEAFVNALKNKGGWSEDYWSNNIDIYRFHTQRYHLSKPN